MKAGSDVTTNKRLRWIKLSLPFATVLLCLVVSELFLRFVYDPLGWLGDERWQERLYEELYRRDRHEVRDSDPDLKHTFGGSRRSLPLPYESYKKYVGELYQPAAPPLNYVHRPNVEVEFGRTDFFKMTVTTNSMGLRDDEISWDKAKNEVRILFVGDSITFGSGVDDQATFVERLESIINEDSGPDFTFEIVNYGIGGYNLSQEYHLLVEKNAGRLQPDLILVGIALNDDGETNNFVYWEQTLGHLANTTLSKRLQVALGQDLQVGRLMLWSLHLMKEAYQRVRADKTLISTSSIILRDEGCAWLRDLGDYADQLGVPLGYVVFPQEFQFDQEHMYSGTTARKYDLWLNCARGTGRPTLDVLAGLETRYVPAGPYVAGSVDKGLYVRDSIHLNEAGHMEVAALLLPFIEENWAYVLVQ